MIVWTQRSPVVRYESQAESSPLASQGCLINSNNMSALPRVPYIYAFCLCDRQFVP